MKATNGDMTGYNETDLPNTYSLYVTDNIEWADIWRKMPEDCEYVIVHDAQKRGRYDRVVPLVCRRHGYDFEILCNGEGDKIHKVRVKQ